MKKNYKSISIAVLITIGIAGCGVNDDGAIQNKQRDRALPIGYYSNENHGNGGNARLNEENDGPLVEMMDHTFGAERDQTRQVNNGNTIRENRKNNMFNREPRFSRSDANYHGHLDQNNDGARSSYFTAYEGTLSFKINDAAAKVENVKDVRTAVKGGKVIVAVVLENNSNVQATKTAIRKAVQPQLNGKSLTIVTDEGTFSRIRTIDNSLRDGGPKDEMEREITNMFRSVGNRANENAPFMR